MSVVAYLRNEEDGRRIAIGLAAEDIFAVADGPAQSFWVLVGRLWIENCTPVSM